MIIRSYAKLNLFLHVTGKYKTSFHKLKSLVGFCENLYDEISIIKNSQKEFIFHDNNNQNIEIENNILAKTLKTFLNNSKLDNYKITVNKNIPIGAGLGGGSSNAASLFKCLLNKIKNNKNIEDNLLSHLTKIGSDVPVCYYNKFSHFKGVGDVIYPTKIKFTPYAVILFPKTSISTKAIFNMGFKHYSHDQQTKYHFKNYKELTSYIADKKNDLYENAVKIYPELANFIFLLNSQTGCDLARMTGSGSAIFGLFKTKKLAINAYNNLKQNKKILVIFTGLV